MEEKNSEDVEEMEIESRVADGRSSYCSYLICSLYQLYQLSARSSRETHSRHR